jgi:hypothetical protein
MTGTGARLGPRTPAPVAVAVAPLRDASIHDFSIVALSSLFASAAGAGGGDGVLTAAVFFLSLLARDDAISDSSFVQFF